MSSPKNWTRPAVGGKSPVMALNKVVLPAPLAPRIARRSPAGTAKLMSSIARKAPNCRVTRSSTSASPDSAAEAGCVARGSSTTEAIASQFALRAVGHVARTHLEVGRLQSERLIDVLFLADDLVVKPALL